MTGIIQTARANAALQSLRLIQSSLGTAQQNVSSGLRIETAADNAAYWSISTTMRSDHLSMSAVSDALGLAAAKVDVASAGLGNVIDVMSEIKSRLVAAQEGGVDKSKIQRELDQMKGQIHSIATSSAFSGQNWLRTDIADIYDIDKSTTSLVSSFTRDGAGQVSVDTMAVHVADLSLFNSTGGGLLDRDMRDVRSIGGLRENLATSMNLPDRWSTSNADGGYVAIEGFDFAGPLIFDDPADVIRFDITVDKDNPAEGMAPPYNPGKTSSIVIDRAMLDTVDAANTGLAKMNGTISTNEQYAAVLNHALTTVDNGIGAGASVYANYAFWDDDGVVRHDPISMSLWSNQDRSLGLDGSYVEIANFTSTVQSGPLVTDPIMSGGLGNLSEFGSRAKGGYLFEPFTMYNDGGSRDGIEISFTFSVNGEPATQHAFDRTTVNALLGKTNSQIETASEMVTLLHSLLDTDWPNLIIEADASGHITMERDPLVDRRSGSGTSVSFSNISVSHEPISTFNLDDIDIVAHPERLTLYMDYIDKAQSKIIDGAATLGALGKRIDMQSAFTRQMMETVQKGIGRLVDADMNEASARIKALQTQEQLAIQSLQIVNADAQTVLTLFR
jgi:flagellin